MTTMIECRIETLADSVVAQGITSGEELEALTEALWVRIYGPAGPRLSPEETAGIAAVRARLRAEDDADEVGEVGEWWEDEADHELIAAVTARVQAVRARLAKLLGEEPQEETLPKAA